MSDVSSVPTKAESQANASPTRQMLEFLDGPEGKSTCLLIVGLYLLVYAVVSGATLSFFPSYSYPSGDEGTYFNYAQNPWTLIGDFFDGYPPKEAINPYNFRIFLAPFSLVFSLFGFTVAGARGVMLAYGILLLLTTYVITAHLTKRTFAMAAVLLQSLAPPFIMLSHIARPEAMLTLLNLVLLLLLLRQRGMFTRGNYFLVAFLSSTMLWMHYNAVIAPVVFFATLYFTDCQSITWGKFFSYVAGGLAFLALYIPINILPALDTIREFGVMPVTFVSSNKMPITMGPSVNAWFAVPLVEYLRLAINGSHLESNRTTALTAVLAGFALYGLLKNRKWPETLFGVNALAWIAAMFLIFPNRRAEYAYTLHPFLFIFAMVGMAKLDVSWKRGVAWGGLAVAGVAYLFSDVASMDTWYRASQSNQVTAQTIRAAIDHFGGPSKVTIMGPQEYHGIAYDTRFRTFHSLIESKDFRLLLAGAKPQIVIVDSRTIEALANFLFHEYKRRAVGQRINEEEFQQFVDEGLLGPTGGGGFAINRELLLQKFIQTLDDEGYQLVANDQLTWNGEKRRVLLYLHTGVRASGPKLEALERSMLPPGHQPRGTGS
ncbi:MAG: glycosyltransferase family 39 protein [Planctomycetota bacterium]